MPHAGRRALARLQPTIRVTNRVDVVPMEHVQTFFNYEIAREGKWRDDVPVIIMPSRTRGGKGG